MRKHRPAVVVARRSPAWRRRAAAGGTPGARTPRRGSRTGVDVVEVAVLARDREGKPVTDLTRDEITVLENGVPQTLVAFEQVSLPVRRR